MTIRTDNPLNAPQYPVNGGRDTVSALGVPLYETSTTRKYPLGTRYKFEDGRVFHYCYNGSGSTLAKAYLQGHNLVGIINTVIPYASYAAPASAAIGSKVLLCTNATAVRAANAFADGYVVVNAGTGIGQVRKIKESEACTTTTGTFKIELYDGLDVALDATSYITITTSPFSLKVFPAAGLVLPIGYPVVAIVNGSYGWVQTYGPCAVTSGDAGGTTVTTRVMCPDAATAGEVKTAVAGSRVIAEQIQADARTDGGITVAFLTLIP